jgi:hypothetical protein
VCYLPLLDFLWLGRAFLVLFFTFALASIVPQLQMRTCVAAHVALDAKCAVTSLKGASEWTFACVAVYVDLEAARASKTFAAVLTLIFGRRLVWGYHTGRRDRAEA